MNNKILSVFLAGIVLYGCAEILPQPIEPSSGHITAYHEGSPILELERPLQRSD